MKYKKLSQLFTALLFAVISHSAFAQQGRPPKQEKLLNGLKVLLWEDQSSDKVAVSLRIHSGAAFDPQGKEGTIQLLADSLFPDAAIRDSFYEDLDGSLAVTVNHDYIQIDATADAEHLLRVLEIISSAVSNPVIDKDSTDKVRAALLARLRTLNSDPSYLADQAIAARLFGTFPYGRPVLGTSASVERITFADLIDARVRFLAADNAMLTIAGKIDRSFALKAARRLFGSWLKGERKIPPTFKQPDPPAMDVLTITSPVEGVGMARYAVRGVSRSDKEFPESLIFSNILEQRLRARSGQAVVRNMANRLPGMIIISVPDTLFTNAQLAAAITAPIAETEFAEAKRTAAAQWNARPANVLWLDADTYELRDAASQRELIANTSLASVKSYSERVAKLPVAAVLLTVPASK